MLLKDLYPNLGKGDAKLAAAFREADDKYRFLGGRLLLLRWVEQNGFSKSILQSITFDEYGKPTLPGISFSISHSANWVALIVAKSGILLGLDIEVMKDIDVHDYLPYLTAGEQEYILQTDITKRFYELWTRKEAVLKAIGKGFIADPATLDVMNNEVIVQGKQLFLQKIDTPNGVVGHAAIEGYEGVQINIQTISI